MRKLWIFVSALVFAASAAANDIGQIKVAKGDVQVERSGARVAATVGMPVRATDVVVTGANGSAGITFSDNSLVSVGPNSVFAIDKYRFDTTTTRASSRGRCARAGWPRSPARSVSYTHLTLPTSDLV